MKRRGISRLSSLVAGLLGLCLLSGCSFSIYDLPLPGGASAGDHPMQVTVEFEDVLDLVPQSTVKVNEVSVGEVSKVKLVKGHAQVQLQIRDDTKLPANAVANIRQTSLLGEKFVALSAPATGASPALLRDGAVIPLERAGRNPEIEEVLGALSLVLNGGGVAQLKTIATELNRALDGREDSARSVLTQIDTLMANLDDNKASIVQAITSLDRLARSVRRQESTIDAALAELPSALRSLDAQRDDLVRALQALSKLGTVGTRVIRASKQSTVDVIRNLQPTLTELANAGDDLVNALDTAFTYPFTDDVVGRDPQAARNLHMGDYVNLDVTLDVDLSGLIGAIGRGDVLPPALDPTKVVDDLLACISSADPNSAACKRVRGTTDLLTTCRRTGNQDAAVCQLLNLVPGLPPAPGLPLPGLGGSRGSGGGTSTGSGGPLGNLGGLLGLGRAPAGAAGSAGSSSTPATLRLKDPTVAQLSTVYDPAMVSLMAPGLLTGPATGTTTKGADR